MTPDRRSARPVRRAVWPTRPVVVSVAVLVLVAVALSGGPGAGAQQPPPAPSAQELRDTADEVLARQEFQRPEPTVLERIRDWVGERLEEVVRGLTGGGAGSVVGWVVLVLALGALAWSLSRLGRTVRADPAAGVTVRIDQGRSPDEWRHRAERAEAEADWKQALLFRYRALLGDLVRAGVIEDVPGRTTGEYRREVVAAHRTAAVPFGEATELFELAWYADGPAGPDEAACFRRDAEATVAATSTTPASAAPTPAGVG